MKMICRLFLFIFCVALLAGCIRLSGSAGYSHVKDDEIVSKSTGFDLDSTRLLSKGNAS